MADATIAKRFTTISIGATGDTVTTRGSFVRVKNLGGNVVSYSEAANPTGAVTAGNQSSILAAPASGLPDFALLRPSVKYYFRAAVGATLCGFEEVEAVLFK